MYQVNRSNYGMLSNKMAAALIIIKNNSIPPILLTFFCEHLNSLL